MVFGYSVAGRTRSRKGDPVASSRSGGVGSKKGAAFRPESRRGRPRKSGNGGKARPLARRRIDEYIDISDSSSDDDGGFTEFVQDSGGGSGGVRVGGGGGDAESVISIGTTSSDDDDSGEVGPSRVREERLPVPGPETTSSSDDADEAGPSRVRIERLPAPGPATTSSGDDDDEAGPSRVRKERLPVPGPETASSSDDNDEAGPSRVRKEKVPGPETTSGDDKDEAGPSIIREETVPSAEATSRDKEDEAGPSERLTDKVPGPVDIETSSSSSSESESESDGGEDDNFSLGSDRLSVESEEEEEEDEDEEEEEDVEEDSRPRSKKPATPRRETLFGDGGPANYQVVEEVIDITSSEDDSDDFSGVSRRVVFPGAVVLPGAVASRTRSKRSGGGRKPQRDEEPAPCYGAANNGVEKGKNVLSESMGSQKKRKTASAVICKSKESDGQPNLCDSTQSKRDAAVKNGVEKEKGMLNNSTGPEKKRKAAPEICKSKKSDEQSNSCDSTHSKRDAAVKFGVEKKQDMLNNNPVPQKKRKAAPEICKSKKSDEKSNSCDSTHSKRDAAVENGVEKEQDMLSNSIGPQEKREAAPDISKSKKSDENSNSPNSDHASSTEVERTRDKPRSKTKFEFFTILADSILKKNGKDEVQEQRRALEVLPVAFPWPPVEEEPVEKTESEKEMDDLWHMCNLGIQADQIGSSSVRDEEPDTGDLNTSQQAMCRRGKHWLFLDEEIGMRCKYCSYIETEIRDYCPPVEILPSEAPYRSYYRDQGNPTSLDGLEVGAPEGCAAECFKPICDGTVWDLIPGIRNEMYPHQQEAFEFMWKNLAGSVSLDDLKSSSLQEKDIGGCIISHAPGTGKTRLTLVFLQAYLELFPDSRPVIIAPAGLLLTWEGEIKKWGVGVPFHNLNTELTGREDLMALRMLDSHRLSRNTNSIRMVKLYTWSTTKSILLLSYDLFVKLTGQSSSTKEIEKMREILLKEPRVVILDEGHIPRNQDSQVWNLVIKLETKKRVILSGTPFQNNFEELLNTLHLVRQKIAESIPRSLKKFCQRGRGPAPQIDDDPAGAIEKIKSIMAPYVHIHKGSILQKSLPGRKDCVVVLNPGELQLEVLKSFFGGSENDSEAATMKRKDRSTFDFEHKQALISLHPSLALGMNFSPEEKSLIFRNEEKLKAYELNPSKGVKTRFLKEFIQLCISMGEKVLVFSQYIKPLDFIALQLGKAFEWTTGREVLVMIGNLCMNQRQSMINLFNDPDSDARVLLASTKACSEGINLVGASRVILLDVVWNPAVERQAISRAYRLGQKKMVYTYHLIMKETYEWEKYQKQAHKDRLSELVFSAGAASDGDPGEKSLCTVSEDRILEEMISHPKLRGLFHQIKYHPKRIDSVEHFGPTA